MRRQLDPEGHRTPGGLDGLLNGQCADGWYLVVGEPAGHANLTHGRLPLACAGDTDDYLAWQAPYFVLGDPDGFGARGAEACEGAGFFQCCAGG
ncbi:hypothetical protein ABZ915_43525 [Streptomyces sp. NPDC046915]|uniref:hypothetical protein n=1 Tax=Streptomyces sp. NPDC046915 TaxID=3155257 RepID=UPI0033E2D9B9